MSKVEVYFARERRDAAGTSLGVWEYVVEIDDGRVMPTGYCRPWLDKTEADFIKEHGAYLGAQRFEQHLRRAKWKDKHHSTGHISKTEACKCFRSFRLDQELTFSPISYIQQATGVLCILCKRPAVQRAEFIGGGARFLLCGDHATKASVDEVFPIDCPPFHVIFY